MGPIHWPPRSMVNPAGGDVGEGAPADPVAGIEHQDVDAGAGQVAGGGQARVAGADDHHLALPVQLGHRPLLLRWGTTGPGRPR